MSTPTAPGTRQCIDCGVTLIGGHHWRRLSSQQRTEARNAGQNCHRSRGLCGICYDRRLHLGTVIDAPRTTVARDSIRDLLETDPPRRVSGRVGAPHRTATRHDRGRAEEGTAADGEGRVSARHRFNNDLRYRDDSHEMQRQLTPDYILEPVRAVLGGIDLDPCTEPDNPTDARVFYTAEMDGAATSWNTPGITSIYVNPPYGKARERWVERCIEAAAGGMRGRAADAVAHRHAPLPPRDRDRLARRVHQGPREVRRPACKPTPGGRLTPVLPHRLEPPDC